MIVLFVILLGHTTVPSDDLVDDVKKSRDILRSMEEASVARRSADLMTEVLDVARAYAQQKRSARSSGSQAVMQGHEDQRQVHSYDTPYRSDDDFSRSFFPHTDLGQDPGGLLASLMDPNMLQDFTAVIGTSVDMDFSNLPVYGTFDHPLGDQDWTWTAPSDDWQGNGNNLSGPG